MKKLFTLVAATLFMAANAGAQSWTLNVEMSSIDAGATLIDDDYMTVKTVFAAKVNSGEATCFEKAFAGDVQVRVDAAPSAFVFSLRGQREAPHPARRRTSSAGIAHSRFHGHRFLLRPPSTPPAGTFHSFCGHFAMKSY